MGSFAREIFGRFIGKERFTIFLLEDNKLFLNSLKAQLSQSCGGDVDIKAFSDSKTLIENMCDCPGVVVMDYHLDEESSIEGVDLINRLKWSNPSTKLIVLTCEEKVDVAMKCYEAGADNYIKKDLNAIKVLIKELVYKKDLVE